MYWVMTLRESQARKSEKPRIPCKEFPGGGHVNISILESLLHGRRVNGSFLLRALTLFSVSVADSSPSVVLLPSPHPHLIFPLYSCLCKTAYPPEALAETQVGEEEVRGKGKTGPLGQHSHFHLLG